MERLRVLFCCGCLIQTHHVFCRNRFVQICFPIFGPAPEGSTMPQHGFARVNTWEYKGSHNEGDMATTAEFELLFKNVSAGIGENNPWANASSDGTDCKLTYKVRVEAEELTTTLKIENTGTSSFDFKCLLHTYLAVDNVSDVKVHGLGGYAITDKVSGDSGHVQSYDDDIVIDGEVDAVYIHPDNHPTIHAKVFPNGVRIEAAGQVDEVSSPVSCVVWNPGKDKAAGMSDFGDEEYKNMVCVEPGLIGHQPLLTPGATARLSQSLLVASK